VIVDYKTKNYLVKDSVAILTPSYLLSTWVVASGSIKYSIAPKNLTSNKYREPINLYRNNVLMTKVANSGLIDTELKWSYDSATGKIYIKVVTVAIMVMTFNLYYASRGFKLPNDLLSGPEVYYEPRIINNPSFINNTKDKFIGVSVVSEASFSLINVENDYFESIDKMLYDANYSFYNKKCLIYRILTQEDNQPVQLLFSGYIDSWSMDNQQINFTATDFVRQLDNSVQTVEYNITTYPLVDPSMIGLVERIIYGKATVKVVNISYVEGGTTSQNRIWKVSLHPNKAIDAIYIKRYSTTTPLTITTHYSLNADKNIITLVNNVEALLGISLITEREEIYATVQGKMDGSLNLIQYPGDVVKDIFTLIGISTSDLDLAKFDTGNAFKLGFAIPQGVSDSRPTARDVIDKINETVIGFLYNTNEFKIAYSIAGMPTFTYTSSKTLDKDIDLIGRQQSADKTDMISFVAVRYRYDEMNQNYVKTHTLTDNNSSYLHNNYQTKTIETLLYGSIYTTSPDVYDYEILATRYLYYFSRPYITESFTLKQQIDDKMMGDCVTIDGRVYEIIKLDKSINDTNVTVRLV
jgi:hypothetical protein